MGRWSDLFWGQIRPRSKVIRTCRNSVKFDQIKMVKNKLWGLAVIICQQMLPITGGGFLEFGMWNPRSLGSSLFFIFSFHIILFYLCYYFILFHFILFHFVSFVYFISLLLFFKLNFILFHFISIHFISFRNIGLGLGLGLGVGLGLESFSGWINIILTPVIRQDG